MSDNLIKEVPLKTWNGPEWQKIKAKTGLELRKLYSTRLQTCDKTRYLCVYGEDDYPIEPLYRFKCSEGFWKHLGGEYDLKDAQAKIECDDEGFFLLIYLTEESVASFKPEPA